MPPTHSPSPQRAPFHLFSSTASSRDLTYGPRQATYLPKREVFPVFSATYRPRRYAARNRLRGWTGANSIGLTNQSRDGRDVGSSVLEAHIPLRHDAPRA